MMSESALQLDPAVEEILRDIASDPDACLLRVPRPRALSALSRGETVELGGVTGLTTAERELVRVHRAEVAYLLRVLCARSLLEAPDSESYVVSASPPDSVPTAEEWRQSAQSTIEAAALIKETAGSDLLLRYVTSPDASAGSVSELALASIRLQPTPQARIYVALDRMLHGEPWTGIRVLEGVLARGVSDVLASQVWENLGFARYEQRRLPEALLAFDRAVALDPLRPTPLLNSLAVALQLGNERVVFDRAGRLEEFAGEDSRRLGSAEQLRRQGEAMSRQREGGHWNPSSDGSRLRLVLSDRAGPAMRRILDVFA